MYVKAELIGLPLPVVRDISYQVFVENKFLTCTESCDYKIYKITFYHTSVFSKCLLNQQ